MKLLKNVAFRRIFSTIQEAVELDLIITIISLVIIGGIWVWISNDIPSGIDSGNWLYISHNICKQSNWYVPPYPPMVPFLLIFFEGIWGALLGVKIFGFFSLLTLSIPIYFLLKPFKSPIVTILGSFSIPFVEYNLEILGWGGYPQLLATTFALMSIIIFNNFINKPSRKNAILSGIFTSLVLNTNFLVSIYLAVCLIIILFIQIYLLKSNILKIIKYIPILLLSLIFFTLPGFNSIISTFQQSSGLMVGVQGFSSILEIFTYIFKLYNTNTLYYWAILIVISSITFFIPSREEIRQIKIVCFSMIFTSLILITIKNEPRFGSFIQFNILILTLIFIFSLKDVFKLKINTNVTSRAIKLIIIIILFMNFISGVEQYQKAYNYYNVLTDKTINALDWINKNIEKNETIACAGYNKNGNLLPMGWWIQGYTNTHTLVGSDNKWMNFVIEKKNAELVNQIFDNNLPIEKKVELMNLNKITYLVFILQYNGQYEDIITSSIFEILYSEEVYVLKIK